MIEQFINFVIRPPRADYNPDQYLWDSEFNLAGRKYKRQDLELTNGRGYTLQCSHYVPANFSDDTPLPCVIYCHGNSGCRADANDAAIMLLPLNITLFTLDFSGSGLSDGDYVSLGWHEKDDLKTVVSFLRNSKKTSSIGLWGRSMGAVTSLLYGVEDPSIVGMVLDSAFSNLYSLMMELASVYKIRLPKFTIKMGLQYMRRVIRRRAQFDIMELNTIQFAPKTFIPVLFGHANDDVFVLPHHSDHIYKSYAGEKNIIKFDGDHNSPRPQFYYDSVSIFFYNVLQPPQSSSTLSRKLEKYYDLSDLRIGSGMDENLLYEIITSLHAASSTDASGSSSASGIPKVPTTKSVIDLLAEYNASNKNDEILLDEEKIMSELAIESDVEETHTHDKESGSNQECCSYSSSNRESWGRCSSLCRSEEEPTFIECTSTPTTNKQPMTFRSIVSTPLRRFQRKSNEDEPKKKKSSSTTPKKTNREKLKALRLRLQHYISRRRHHPSS
ncbi:hypothetical protein ZOSMA_262G00130 [Zostera marina]|uniref:Serine aminopeptidase S33 domain-containing protein n=1 Tax=Zostera marina TaxID=29655 RepID=A0A0K9PF33_ZOSMR|nr:hypothetical protein ZOSMA_262G00130 [Zostera marina]